MAESQEGFPEEVATRLRDALTGMVRRARKEGEEMGE